MVTLLVTKIIVLFSLLVATLIFSMLPLRLQQAVDRQMARARKHRYKTGMSFMSCFAAGVFLATCLLDLFPEVRSNVSDALEAAHIDTKFPVPEFILVLGLIFILLVEQIVLMCHRPQAVATATARSPLLGNGGARGDLSQQQDLYRPDQYDSLAGDSYGDLSQSQGELSASEDEVHVTEEDLEDKADGKGKELYQDPNSHSPIRSLVLLCALSLHSIFEGLALGLQPDSNSLLQLFTAVVIHKSVLAFSLGLNLAQSTLSLKAFVRSVLTFSLTAPVGIAIGIVITDFSRDSAAAKLTNGILQGIACGTFLYIVFFEILPHEFMTKRQRPNRMLKMLFLLLGYATTVTLLFIHPG